MIVPFCNRGTTRLRSTKYVLCNELKGITELELQLYHSIHARGERVEDVLKAAEMAETEIAETDPSMSAAIAQSNGGNDEDVEDGELMGEADEQGIGNNNTTDQPVSIACSTWP